jgi:hypothetical protein
MVVLRHPGNRENRKTRQGPEIGSGANNQAGIHRDGPCPKIENKPFLEKE